MSFNLDMSFTGVSHAQCMRLDVECFVVNAVVVAVCEKILVDDPYHYAVGYAALYVLLLSVSFQL